MSTTDEAIALAREIVGRAAKDPETPHWYRIGGTKAHRLATALLAAASPGAQFRAGMEAAAQVCYECGYDGDGSVYRAIRTALAATLPASPEPAPVAMPELRWREGRCLLGQFRVGVAYRATDPARTGKCWAGSVHASKTEDIGFFATEPEARTAVEAAVHERLNTKGPE